MTAWITGSLRTLNDLLTAGIAITAFSLLLYALSFNLRDRVARSFAIVLMCVVGVFVSEALGSVASHAEQIEMWLKLQWLGIVFLPPAYLHLSDAILATTGRPSRGRRRIAVRLSYGLGLGFLVTLALGWLVGPLVVDGQPVHHLQRTWVTMLFTLCYALAMLLSAVNFWRAYQRTATSTSRRRMRYLMISAAAPALGSYPYLLFGSSLAAQLPLVFWAIVVLGNIMVSVLLVLMAYAVAFFGVPWPDRVVKRRLFKWLLRGPVTASTVLSLTTIVRRSGGFLGIPDTTLVPVVMAGSILVMEHLITLTAPIWERVLFAGGDHEDMEMLQTLEERLLTRGDIKQFLEAVLAAACDRLQVTEAFVAAISDQGLGMLVAIGGDRRLEDEDLSENLLEIVSQNGNEEELFTWGDFWLIPLFETDSRTLLGLMGVLRNPEQSLDDEQRDALTILSERAAIALHDRRRQQQAFSSLEALKPQMESIQRLRAAARYDQGEALNARMEPIMDQDLTQWVKEALTHYWGGPKLTESPLMKLKVVQQVAAEQEESSTNALRSILRQAIEYTRPEGERRFTAEWILYNILEMKFMEGRKVREIALRLAMSEADLYRKQRVAIEAVAKAIAEMEAQANQISPVIEAGAHFQETIQER